MENQPEIRFYSFYVQYDESHSEELFMTVGQPQKSFEEIEKEAQEAFYFAVSEGEEIDFSEIFLPKLKEYGYQEVKVEKSISFCDPYYMSSKCVREMIEAKEGDTYYNEHFKEQLNALRIQRGKEPFPFVRKIVPKDTKQPEPKVMLDYPERSLGEQVIFDAFDAFLRSIDGPTSE